METGTEARHAGEIRAGVVRTGVYGAVDAAGAGKAEAGEEAETAGGQAEGMVESPGARGAD